MRDHERGLVAAADEAENLVLQRAAGEGVERAEGFVHQQKCRFDREGAGDADALFHAARQLGGHAVGGVVEADQVEHFAGLISDAGALPAGVTLADGEGHVIER